MKDQTYIENIRVYKVANGHVVQIKLVGIATESTYICSKDDSLIEVLEYAINTAIEEKH